MLIVLRLLMVVRLVDGVHEAQSSVFEEQQLATAAAHAKEVAALKAELHTLQQGGHGVGDDDPPIHISV